jgi:hypothetical protein
MSSVDYAVDHDSLPECRITMQPLGGYAKSHSLDAVVEKGMPLSLKKERERGKHSEA